MPDDPRADLGNVDLSPGTGTDLYRLPSIAPTGRRLEDPIAEAETQSSRRLDEFLSQISLVERLSQLQRAILDREPLDEVLASIAAASCELIGTDISMLRLLDRDDPSQTILKAAVGTDPRATERGSRAPATSGIGGEAINRRGLIVVETADRATDEGDTGVATHGIVAAMAAPITHRGDVAGSLEVGSREPRRFELRDRQILLTLAEHVALALNHARAIEDAIHESFHDSLTDLPNQALFLDHLRHALARAERTGHNAAVIVCDLDGVRQSLAPSISNQALAELGRRIGECTRAADTVARLGGGVFAALIDDVVDSGDAVRASRRIIAALEEPFEIDGREVYPGATASIGIAIGSRDPEALLRSAGVAAFEAKTRRDRYAVAGS